MKNRFTGALLIGVVFVSWHCQFSQNKANKLSALPANAVPLLTHKEAADTLRADTTQPIKASIFRPLSAAEGRMVLNSIRLDSVLAVDYPDNGFYGDDHYRIEFVFTQALRDPNNPALYHLKGKNRYKKTISAFSGEMEFQNLEQFFDPNIDTSQIDVRDILKMYACTGRFELREDSSLASSGVFRGDFKIDFSLSNQNMPDLWFFTNDTPAKGSGYRFDGVWTPYKQSDVKKPVLWSRDLFRFANNILQDFSYGEREIEINPKYRSLGWENFWDGEEWWHEGAPKTIQ